MPSRTSRMATGSVNFLNALLFLSCAIYLADSDNKETFWENHRVAPYQIRIKAGLSVFVKTICDNAEPTFTGNKYYSARANLGAPIGSYKEEPLLNLLTSHSSSNRPGRCPTDLTLHFPEQIANFTDLIEFVWFADLWTTARHEENKRRLLLGRETTGDQSPKLRLLQKDENFRSYLVCYRLQPFVLAPQVRD